MIIDYLANRTEYIPTLAQWYFDEWGYLQQDATVTSISSKLQAYLHTDRVPLVILAIEQNTLAGAAQLKFTEMSIYPEKEHWLGGVYVSPDSRNRGIARLIIEHVVAIARNLGVHTLHLQTRDPTGGLYKRLGWQPVESVNYNNVDVLVMERQVGS